MLCNKIMKKSFSSPVLLTIFTLACSFSLSRAAFAVNGDASSSQISSAEIYPPGGLRVESENDDDRNSKLRESLHSKILTLYGVVHVTSHVTQWIHLNAQREVIGSELKLLEKNAEKDIELARDARSNFEPIIQSLLRLDGQWVDSSQLKSQGLMDFSRLIQGIEWQYETGKMSYRQMSDALKSIKSLQEDHLIAKELCEGRESKVKSNSDALGVRRAKYNELSEKISALASSNVFEEQAKEGHIGGSEAFIATKRAVSDWNISEKLMSLAKRIAWSSAQNSVNLNVLSKEAIAGLVFRSVLTLSFTLQAAIESELSSQINAPNLESTVRHLLSAQLEKLNQDLPEIKDYYLLSVKEILDFYSLIKPTNGEFDPLFGNQFSKVASSELKWFVKYNTDITKQLDRFLIPGLCNIALEYDSRHPAPLDWYRELKPAVTASIRARAATEALQIEMARNRAQAQAEAFAKGQTQIHLQALNLTRAQADALAQTQAQARSYFKEQEEDGQERAKIWVNARIQTEAQVQTNWIQAQGQGIQEQVQSNSIPEIREAVVQGSVEIWTKERTQAQAQAQANWIQAQALAEARNKEQAEPQAHRARAQVIRQAVVRARAAARVRDQSRIN